MGDCLIQCKCYVCTLSGLKSITDVLLKCPDWQSRAKTGILAIKVAQETLFGDPMVYRCTRRGRQDMLAFPQKEVSTLKTVMYQTYCIRVLDTKWVIAQEAVAQACTRLIKCKHFYTHSVYFEKLGPREITMESQNVHSG